MRKLIEAEFARLLPGSGAWPAWTDIDATPFWAGLRNDAPWSIRVGLAGAALIMRCWCAVQGGDGYAAALDSRSFLLRQSATIVRTFAAIAYFSDPTVQQLGRGHA